VKKQHESGSRGVPSIGPSGGDELEPGDAAMQIA
jgi:hypothetical protein